MFASLWSDLCNVTNLELRFLILLHCMFQDSFLLIDTGEGEGEGRGEGEAEERRGEICIRWCTSQMPMLARDGAGGARSFILVF